LLTFSWKMNARERLGQTVLGQGAASAFPSKPQSRTSVSAYNAAVNFLARPKQYSADRCRAAELNQVVEDSQAQQSTTQPSD